MMTVGSLFSGIGGFELGLERTGCFKTVWQCEKDAFCLKVLEKHWPDVKRFTDIHEMKEDIPYVDVICGGFPCQDISCAGKGAGIHAERSGLWWEMLRIVRLVRPRYVLVENVAALLNRGLDEVLGSLAESGYDAEWNIVSAAGVGAPHLRKRVFIVAHPGQPGRQQITGSSYGNEATDERRPQDEDHEFECDGQSSRERSLAHANSQPSESPIRDPGRGQALVETEPSEQELGCAGDTSREIADSKSIRCGGGQMLSEAARKRWGICAEGDNSWSTESGICRVANGVPSRVDRLRALGNAIVPQCAEYVGRCVLAAEGTHEPR